ncbi:MAG: hypothetical protein RL215_2051 [Planctomycetota bacterium]
MFARRELRMLVCTALICGSTMTRMEADERPGVTGAAASVGHESWYSIEFEGRRAGYELVQSLQLPGGDERVPPGRRLIRRVRQTRLNLQRSGTTVSLTATLETQETADGLLESWELTRMGADGSFIERRGRWDAEQRAMIIEDEAKPNAQTERIAAEIQPHSPVFTEWLGGLRLAEGRGWSGDVFFPETAVSAEVEVQRLGQSSLLRPDGTRPAAVRLSWEPVSAPELKTRVFLDAGSGDCLLVEQPLLGRTLRLVRSTPEAALDLPEGGLDLQLQAMLPVQGRLPQPIPAEGVRLEVRWQTLGADSLPASRFQVIESRVPGRQIVACLPVRWPDGEGRGKELRNEDLYLQQSRWMDFDDVAVRRLQAVAGGGTETPMKTSRRLADFVHRRMKFSAFSTQLQPASQIADRLQGDCTEHAVLLCAMLRGRGIPARVASGFVFVPQLSAFAPHLWTEAWVDGLWLPLDSTVSSEVALPLLLKAGDSPLSNDISSGAALFMPLLSLCGQAEVLLLEDEPEQRGRDE